MFLDYSCSAPKQAVGLTYPEPDFSPEVQSLSVPLYGEQFRQFPINAEIMSLLESCHLMPVEVPYFFPFFYFLNLRDQELQLWSVK